MLCGAKSLYAIARWGRDSNHLVPLLGFTRRRKPDPTRYRTPCHSELHTVFAGLDVARFEAALTAWVRAAGFDDLDERVLHLDGKRLRGSQGHPLPGVHPLAVYSGELKAVVAQLAVADTNEHKTAPGVLKVLPLGGLILTADAAFTQRDVARPWRPAGATTSCRSRRTNRPSTGTSPPGSTGLFPPIERAERRVAEDRGKGHGRVEHRRIRTTTRRNEYLGWPGLRQVCVVERTRRVNCSETTEAVFYITSLPPAEASPARLLRLIRSHWRVENQLHYVRDASAGEDACRVKTGSAPEVLAGMRNAALTVLRASGQSNTAAAFRHLAAVPRKAVELVTRFVLRLL